MTEHHTDDHPAKLDANEARAARPVNKMRYVLGISLFAIIVIMAIVLAGQAS